MIDLRNIIITVGIVLIILLGVYVGYRMVGSPEENTMNNVAPQNQMIMNTVQNLEISTLETSAEEEKTTPNTLMIYKTYYTKCQHYIQEYKDIDTSLVNCTEAEIKEKCKGWKVEKFSSKEIELSKEEVTGLIEYITSSSDRNTLENKAIVIYHVDENGVETEYEQTGITTEYLTEEDILKLTTGIYIYGKETLTSTIEDYE